MSSRLLPQSGRFREVRAAPARHSISGRRDLTWQVSLRLDLRYVDRWSISPDRFDRRCSPLR
jgi:hypothetical protein